MGTSSVTIKMKKTKLQKKLVDCFDLNCKIDSVQLFFCVTYNKAKANVATSNDESSFGAIIFGRNFVSRIKVVFDHWITDFSTELGPLFIHLNIIRLNIGKSVDLRHSNQSMSSFTTSSAQIDR